MNSIGVSKSFLRFTLNNIFVLHDQPEGWRELELNIKRDSLNLAIYITYSSDLTFYGDGWTYLKYIIDGVGICGRVNVLIEIDRENIGNYKTLYEGIIDLNDFDIDYERCTAKGPVKSSSYLSYITDRFDKKVWYFNNHIEVGTQYTFGGLPVTTQNAAKYVNTHDIVTGVQPSPASTWGTVYRVFDALNYHMQYMTENNVSVVSDFFNNQSFQKGEVLISFDSDLIIGNQIDISFINCYGILITKTVIIISGTQSQMLDQVARAFIQDGDFSTIIGDNLTPATPNEKASAVYGIFDGSKFSNSVVSYSPGIYWRIYLEYVTPITNIIVTRVSSTSHVSVTQPLVYGMKNLFMGFNTELTGDIFGQGIGDKLMSFRELFDMLDARFNLGMQLVQIGTDTFQMRIEPKSYFFNNPQIVDVGSVLNVKAEANNEILFQNLVIGTKGANVNIIKGPSGKMQNWSVGGCSSNITEKNTDGNYDISSIGYQLTNFVAGFQLRYPNDIAFMLSTDATALLGPTSGSPVLSEQFQIRIINSGPHVFNGASEGLLYSYNSGLINFWAVYNHLFSLTGSPQSASRSVLAGPYIVKNSDMAFSRKNFEFDTILTDGEIAMCMLQPTGSIGFKDSSGDQRSDSLFELVWNINSGKAHFKVFG